MKRFLPLTSTCLPLQFYVISALTLSLPGTNNNIFPALQIPSNATKLTEPVPVPGFEAIITFDRTKPLDADQARINFISFLYNLCQREATSIITQPEKYYQQRRPSFWAIAEEPGSQQLQINHVLLGLNEAAKAMVLPQNGFYTAEVQLMLNQQQIGEIHIYVPGGYADNTATIPATNSTPTFPIARNNTNEIARGLIVDRTWRHYAVAWLYDEDKSKAISSNDIFTALMDGLTTAAQFSLNTYCEYLGAGSSESGSGTIADIVLGSYAHTSKLRYIDVKKMLLFMYTKFIVSSNTYREFSFELQYDVVDILAVGSVTVRSVASSGNDGITAFA